jgi:predicted lipoprotein with Yx(FWY)xxD motif
MTTNRLLAGLLLAAGCTLAWAADPASIVNGAMVAGNGMTLYTFDADKTPGTSACNGPAPPSGRRCSSPPASSRRGRTA